MTVSINAGQSYTAKVAVNNASTRLGQPVSAELSVSLVAVVGTTTIVSSQQSYYFSPGEVHVFEFPMSVPSDAIGAGAISALLFDPSGNQLRSASLDISISIPPPNVSIGTITWL